MDQVQKRCLLLPGSVELVVAAIPISVSVYDRWTPEWSAYGLASLEGKYLLCALFCVSLLHSLHLCVT